MRSDNDENRAKHRYGSAEYEGGGRTEPNGELFTKIRACPENAELIPKTSIPKPATTSPIFSDGIALSLE